MVGLYERGSQMDEDELEEDELEKSFWRQRRMEGASQDSQSSRAMNELMNSYLWQ